MAASSSSSALRRTRSEGRDIEPRDREIVTAKFDWVLGTNPSERRDRKCHARLLQYLMERIDAIDLNRCKELVIRKIRKIEKIQVETGPDTKLFCLPSKEQWHTYEVQITYEDPERRSSQIFADLSAPPSRSGSLEFEEQTPLAGGGNIHWADVVFYPESSKKRPHADDAPPLFTCALRMWPMDSLTLVTSDEKLFLFSAQKQRKDGTPRSTTGEKKILYETDFNLDTFEAVINSDQVITELVLLTREAREAYLLLRLISYLDIEPFILRSLRSKRDKEAFGLTRGVEAISKGGPGLATCVRELATSIVKKWDQETKAKSPEELNLQPRLPSLPENRPAVQLENAIFEHIGINKKKRLTEYHRLEERVFRKMEPFQRKQGELFRKQIRESKRAAHNEVDRIAATMIQIDTPWRKEMTFRGCCVEKWVVFDVEESDDEADMQYNLSLRQRRRMHSPFSDDSDADQDPGGRGGPSASSGGTQQRLQSKGNATSNATSSRSKNSKATTPSSAAGPNGPGPSSQRGATTEFPFSVSDKARSGGHQAAAAGFKNNSGAGDPGEVLDEDRAAASPTPATTTTGPIIKSKDIEASAMSATSTSIATATPTTMLKVAVASACASQQTSTTKRGAEATKAKGRKRSKEKERLQLNEEGDLFDDGPNQPSTSTKEERKKVIPAAGTFTSGGSSSSTCTNPAAVAQDGTDSVSRNACATIQASDRNTSGAAKNGPFRKKVRIVDERDQHREGLPEGRAGLETDERGATVAEIPSPVSAVGASPKTLNRTDANKAGSDGQLVPSLGDETAIEEALRGNCNPVFDEGGSKPTTKMETMGKTSKKNSNVKMAISGTAGTGTSRGKRGRPAKAAEPNDVEDPDTSSAVDANAGDKAGKTDTTTRSDHVQTVASENPSSTRTRAKVGSSSKGPTARTLAKLEMLDVRSPSGDSGQHLKRLKKAATTSSSNNHVEVQNHNVVTGTNAAQNFPPVPSACALPSMADVPSSDDLPDCDVSLHENDIAVPENDGGGPRPEAGPAASAGSSLMIDIREVEEVVGSLEKESGSSEKFDEMKFDRNMLFSKESAASTTLPLGSPATTAPPSASTSPVIKAAGEKDDRKAARVEDNLPLTLKGHAITLTNISTLSLEEQHVTRNGISPHLRSGGTAPDIRDCVVGQRRRVPDTQHSTLSSGGDKTGTGLSTREARVSPRRVSRKMRGGARGGLSSKRSSRETTPQNAVQASNAAAPGVAPGTSTSAANKSSKNLKNSNKASLQAATPRAALPVVEEPGAATGRRGLEPVLRKRPQPTTPSLGDPPVLVQTVTPAKKRARTSA
ncbi:unnamed protein product [Amoebophrya sp. A25]|nr:unnamed protein product [Amoebophrya sp. A25]|eukprot:GSA25T00023651001.1